MELVQWGINGNDKIKISSRHLLNESNRVEKETMLSSPPPNNNPLSSILPSKCALHPSIGERNKSITIQWRISSSGVALRGAIDRHSARWTRPTKIKRKNRRRRTWFCCVARESYQLCCLPHTPITTRFSLRVCIHPSTTTTTAGGFPIFPF